MLPESEGKTLTLVEISSDIAIARDLLKDELAELSNERLSIERGLQSVQFARQQDPKSVSIRLIEAETRIMAALGRLDYRLSAVRDAIGHLDEVSAAREAFSPIETVSLGDRLPTTSATYVLVDGDHVGCKLAPQILVFGGKVETYGCVAAVRAWKKFVAKNPHLPVMVYSVDNSRGATDRAIVAQVSRLMMLPRADQPTSILIVSEDKGFDKLVSHITDAGISARRITVTDLSGKTLARSARAPARANLWTVIDEALAGGPVRLYEIGLMLKKRGLRQKKMLAIVQGRGYSAWCENDTIWWIDHPKNGPGHQQSITPIDNAPPDLVDLDN